MIKKIINYILLILVFSFFVGCSSKQANVLDNHTDQISLSKKINTDKAQEEDNEDDEDLEDEFEDEFQLDEKPDPFASYNQAMTTFNDKFYIYVLKPTANGYKKVVPQGARESIKNFFHNILYPIRLVNNLLQAKFKNSFEETQRFVINTTIGIFGLFDPASSYFHIQPHEEDFGQTLGYYGVGSGPHIVLPFLGPSNLRDMVSLYPNSLLNPIDYHSDRSYNLSKNTEQTIYLKSFKVINDTSVDDKYETIRKDAVDLYPYLKNMYEQYRDEQIKK